MDDGNEKRELPQNFEEEQGPEKEKGNFVPFSKRKPRCPDPPPGSKHSFGNFHKDDSMDRRARRDK